MKIEVVYKTLKTTEIEVDDNYKTMLNNEKAWGDLVDSLSETVFKKIREIENNRFLDEEDIIVVSDTETNITIYEN